MEVGRCAIILHKNLLLRAYHLQLASWCRIRCFLILNRVCRSDFFRKHSRWTLGNAITHCWSIDLWIIPPSCSYTKTVKTNRLKWLAITWNTKRELSTRTIIRLKRIQEGTQTVLNNGKAFLSLPYQKLHNYPSNARVAHGLKFWEYLLRTRFEMARDNYYH